MVNTYLPKERFFCLRAQYEKLDCPKFPWEYTIDVFNEAWDAVDGNIYGGDFSAYSIKEEPSKLTVVHSFVPKFMSGDYWVIAYDEEKGYALISGGQPTIESHSGCHTGEGINKSGLWIFTHEQAHDDTLIKEV
jgi:hypothetical protein